MYELGWGRKMSYVLAFGVLGAEDVSRAYVADYHQDGWERRRKWDEEDLREVSYVNVASYSKGLLTDVHERLANR